MDTQMFLNAGKAAESAIRSLTINGMVDTREILLIAAYLTEVYVQKSPDDNNSIERTILIAREFFREILKDKQI